MAEQTSTAIVVVIDGDFASSRRRAGSGGAHGVRFGKEVQEEPAEPPRCLQRDPVTRLLDPLVAPRAPARRTGNRRSPAPASGVARGGRSRETRAGGGPSRPRPRRAPGTSDRWIASASDHLRAGEQGRGRCRWGPLERIGQHARRQQTRHAGSDDDHVLATGCDAQVFAACTADSGTACAAIRSNSLTTPYAR
jgi:hypothetical protein